MTDDFITLLANLALTLSFIAALIFGVAEIRAAARDRHERFSLQTLRTFQTRDFAQLIQFILSHDFPSTYEGFQARPAEDQTCFIQFAQEMESIGILVAEQFVDIGLLDKTLGVFVSSAWAKYKPMYLDMRVKLPDPFLGEYFQWLAERTEERMRDNPRRPFFKTKMKTVTAVEFSSSTQVYMNSLPAVSYFQWLQ